MIPSTEERTTVVSTGGATVMLPFEFTAASGRVRPPAAFKTTREPTAPAAATAASRAFEAVGWGLLPQQPEAGQPAAAGCAALEPAWVRTTPLSRMFQDAGKPQGHARRSRILLSR